MKTITEQFIRTLNVNLKSTQIRTNSNELELYSFDGLQLHKAIPGCVVLPESTEEISWIVKQCNKFKKDKELRLSIILLKMKNMFNQFYYFLTSKIKAIDHLSYEL